MKLKGLFWKPVKAVDVSDTIFAGMSMHGVEKDLDLESFEAAFGAKKTNRLFAAATDAVATNAEADQMATVAGGGDGTEGGGASNVVAAAAAGAGSSGGKAKPKPKKVQLIGQKRAQQMGIAMARMHMSPAAIRDSIATLRFPRGYGEDASVAAAHNVDADGIRVGPGAVERRPLDGDTVEALLKLVPTPEEAEAVASFDGEVELLGPPELFVRAVSTVPQLRLRLESVLTARTFSATIKSIEERRDFLRVAVKQVGESVRLRRLIELVLTLGNFMNGGTSRGEAASFSLDTLLKLKVRVGSTVRWWCGGGRKWETGCCRFGLCVVVAFSNEFTLFFLLSTAAAAPFLLLLLLLSLLLLLLILDGQDHGQLYFSSRVHRGSAKDQGARHPSLPERSQRRASRSRNADHSTTQRRKRPESVAGICRSSVWPADPAGPCVPDRRGARRQGENGEGRRRR